MGPLYNKIGTQIGLAQLGIATASLLRSISTVHTTTVVQLRVKDSNTTIFDREHTIDLRVEREDTSILHVGGLTIDVGSDGEVESNGWLATVRC